MPMPHGRTPTLAIVALTCGAPSSSATTCTVLPRPPVTYSVWPSPEITRPIGRTMSPGRSSSPVLVWVLASTRVSACVVSQATNARAPSAVTPPARGGPPVAMVATCAPVSAASTVTELSPSLVTYTTLPPGWIATPSGSLPTGAWLTTLPAATSTSDAEAVSSFDTHGRLPSSTPGPALGRPDSATNSWVPSGETRRPRGRLPTGIRVTTESSDALMTTTLPPSSS